MRHAFFVVCILSMGFPRVVPAPVVAPSSQVQDAAAILSNARTVAVVGMTGRQLKNRLWANPSGERGKQKVEEVLAAWGRYQVVPDPGEADVVLVIQEFQKNINLLRLANLVAEMKAYQGRQPITDTTPPLWSGDAAEGATKLPATKVAEKFRDFVTGLGKSGSQPPPAAAARQVAAGTPTAVSGAREDLVLRLPAGLSVKAGALPYSLLFSRDRCAAYIARYRNGDNMNESVVVGDVRGAEATFINQAALSPDGSRAAYLASFRNDVLASYLIVGDRRDQVQFSRGAPKTTDPQWVPVFSPDGRKLAYKSETPSGKHVIKLADVSEIAADAHGATSYTQLANEQGPEFDDVDQAWFSEDSTHVTYAARAGLTWTIVLDSKPGPYFRDAATPVLSPDGRTPAFRATRDEKKYFVVVGGVEGPAFDRVSRMAFSPDGTTVAYGAQDGRNFYIVIGTERRPVTRLADNVVFSNDGKRVSYWVIEGLGNRERIIVNDKAGPEFAKVGWPVFDAAANVAAYWAWDKDKLVMVAGDRRSERFDGLGRTRVFNEDGSEVGFGVLRGNELRWVVMKTR